MNYRHAYHAGNFADVFKHAVLALILRYLNNKPGGWRFIDTHAGPGVYDLDAAAPARTGEWRSGIGRLAAQFGLTFPSEGDGARARSASPAVAAMLEPLAGAARAVNPDGALHHYPGSPAIARHFARRQDRLTLTELHSDDAASLALHFAGDVQVKVRALDGWLALGAFVPPKERRGLVLVDPPFEARDEFDRMVRGLANAYRRWPSGCFMLWNPVKNATAVKAYERALFDTGITKVLLAELIIRAPTGSTFDGCGIVIVNPPHTLEGDLESLMPYLASVLAQAPGIGHRVTWIRGEAARGAD